MLVYIMTQILLRKFFPYERVAQLVIQPYLKANYVEVEELSDTERGEGGFGSTGRV